jgi:lambda repressor-like predicted transcriptional regulator
MNGERRSTSLSTSAETVVLPPTKPRQRRQKAAAMPRTELAAVAGLDEDELTEVCAGLGYLGLQLAAVSTSAGVAYVALASLELPAPVYRRLQNHGLHTVADLVNLTPAQVSAIRWVGAKTLTGIRATLQRHGLRLRGDSTEAENHDGR